MVDKKKGLKGPATDLTIDIDAEPDMPPEVLAAQAPPPSSFSSSTKSSTPTNSSSSSNPRSWLQSPRKWANNRTPTHQDGSGTPNSKRLAAYYGTLQKPKGEALFGKEEEEHENQEKGAATTKQAPTVPMSLVHLVHQTDKDGKQQQAVLPSPPSSSSSSRQQQQQPRHETVTAPPPTATDTPISYLSRLISYLSISPITDPLAGPTTTTTTPTSSSKRQQTQTQTHTPPSPNKPPRPTTPKAQQAKITITSSTATSGSPRQALTHTHTPRSIAALTKQHNQRHGSNGLLGPPHPEDIGKKCLILDLDETLVHSSFSPVPNADFIIPIHIDNTLHKVYVLKRPGVDAFLKNMARHYEIVIFTASLSLYADPLLDQLDVCGVVRKRLYREACTFFQGSYVKDMMRMDREQSQVILVDNSPLSFMFQPESAIGCSSFIDDPTDRELDVIAAFLQDIHQVEDVRDHLKDWRAWGKKVGGGGGKGVQAG